MKGAVLGLASLVVGALLVWGGLVVFNHDVQEATVVDCGGQTMSPGQICESADTRHDYDSQKENQESTSALLWGIGGVALMALGAAVALFGCYFLFGHLFVALRYRTRR